MIELDAEQRLALVAEHRERAAFDVAAQHVAVVARRQSGDLQPQIPLLAPEPRQSDVGVRLSGQAVGDAARVVGGVLHRFEAGGLALGVDAGECGAVADRRDRRVGGQKLLVDDDPVRDREPRRRRQLAVRHDPDADQDEIGAEPLAGGQLDMVHPAILSANARRLRAESEIDPGAAMRLGKKQRGRHRDDPTHDPVGQLDDVHLFAVSRARRRQIRGR